ncbi:MAG: hypothetical protein IKM42_06015, partial [Clostridia bacterium]|nr:hypothetical protein [Clostridia bacterium]
TSAPAPQNFEEYRFSDIGCSGSCSGCYFGCSCFGSDSDCYSDSCSGSGSDSGSDSCFGFGFDYSSASHKSPLISSTQGVRR